MDEEEERENWKMEGLSIIKILCGEKKRKGLRGVTCEAR
jgi:hypothetical protein